MFQQRLKELLDENKINYRTLALKTKIPVTTLSNYINRGSIPSATQLTVIADFFDVSIDYLLGRSDDFGNNVAPTQSNVTEKESRLLKAFSTLSALEQDKLIADAEFYSMRHRSKLKQ